MWLGGPISAQETVEAIEQTLIESKEFQQYDIDQVELFNEIIILKPGKQTRGDKKIKCHLYSGPRRQNKTS